MDFLGNGIRIPNIFGDVKNEDEIMMWAKEEDSIKDSIQIILSTGVGERLMQQEFGCTIKNFLYKLPTSDVLDQMKYAIKESLRIWEPRIIVEDVAVLSEGNIVKVEIKYRVITTNNSFNHVFPFKF